uniref:glycogen/starch/alpha-glucan phosphorylase n=1 Tax=Gemmiger formicilis TaxID=745368 RepID=UPI003FEE3AC0
MRPDAVCASTSVPDGFRRAQLILAGAPPAAVITIWPTTPPFRSTTPTPAWLSRADPPAGEKGIDFDEAVEIVTKTCAYTNHTILAEALEKWPRAYLDAVVPQLMPIIEKLDTLARTAPPTESGHHRR